MFRFEDWKGVHPAVRKHIEFCPICKSEAMEPWMNNHKRENLRFSFNICRSCGYAMVFERMFDFLGRWKPDVENDIHWRDNLHKAIFFARRMATKFVDKTTEERALVPSTIEYITYKDEEKWIEEYKEEMRKADEARRNVLSTTYNIPVRDRSGMSSEAMNNLALAESNRRQRERERKGSGQIHKCKKCDKKFPSKQSRKNHERECSGEREEQFRI